MDTREKLIEFVTVALCNQSVEEVVDSLIANGVTVQKWIPVTEERPKQSGEYNVWIVGASQSTSLWYNPVEDVWFNDDYRDDYPVSHWMPMPAPPKVVIKDA